jgi:hypothetical protein
MADEADDAARMSELHENIRIRAARAAAQIREFPPKGSCYNCGRPFDGEPDADIKLVCDEDCMEDWEKRLKRGR